MASGDFPPLVPPGDPDDPGPMNRRNGVFTGRSFPEWGDSNGDFGQLRVLRLEGVSQALPKKPFEIRKSVEAFLGVKIKDAHPENKGVSYIIKLRNEKQVEKLKKMDKLSDGSPIKIAEHPILNQCKCVVYCPESTEYETEELMEELRDQGVKEMRRITRREGTDYIPTPTIILTIEGTVVPQSINFGWIRARTRPYYPTPMLCYGCFEYGHPRKRCQAKNLVCGVCCGDHVNTSENPCHREPFCKHCRSNDHPVMSKKCPMYVKEVDIQHLKVDQGIGYPAARRIWESMHRTNTAAAVVAASNDARFAELNTKFDLLLIETGKKDQQMGFLKQEAEKRDQQINDLCAAVKFRDRIIAEKEARIAALEAALAAANIKIPNPSPVNEMTVPESMNESSMSTGTVKATGAIKKTTKCNSETTQPTSTHKSRPRSRSPRRSTSQKRSKDGRQTKGSSNHGRHPELQSCSDRDNRKVNKPTSLKTTEGKQALALKESGETSPKKQRENQPTKLSVKSTGNRNKMIMSISDDDDELPSAQQITDSIEMDLSSDEPQGTDPLEELP